MNEKYLDDYYLAEILVQDFTNRIKDCEIKLCLILSKKQHISFKRIITGNS